MKLLLLSTGGKPLFRHARQELIEFLAGRRRVGFVTAANLFDEAAYFARAKAFFDSIDIRAMHIRWQHPPNAHTMSLLNAIVVGGGNTYALLDRLRTAKLYRKIQALVATGVPYVGASAGSNLAGANILTTNDMNVVGATRFVGFGFVPWNINPHYPMTKAAVRGGTVFGETRDERIAEYHRVNGNPIAALEEPAIIHVDDSKATVLGKGRIRWIAPGQKPEWFSPGDSLPFIPRIA